MKHTSKKIKTVVIELQKTEGQHPVQNFLLLPAFAKAHKDENKDVLLLLLRNGK